MPRDRDGRPEKPKPQMIQEVLEEKPDLSTRRVQAAVWERYGGEVTPREVSQARRKLRQALAAPPDEGPVAEPSPKKVPRKRPARARKKRPVVPLVDDTIAGDVTMRQLEVIHAAAEEAGGLRKLREAVRVVLHLREQVGDVDDRQLAAALDFLGRVTRKG